MATIAVDFDGTIVTHVFSSEISTLLPKLHDLLLMDGMNQESIQCTYIAIYDSKSNKSIYNTKYLHRYCQGICGR